MPRGTSLLPPRAAALADFDAEALARRLCGSPDARPFATARRVAVRALRHAFGDDARGDAPWTDDALSQAGIGSWARPALLGLDPAIALQVAERAPSTDGTTRLLLRARDGALVEAVVIPAEDGRDRPRCTLCISSQVGCARACTFCETGALGLSRQLTAGEIVDQYRLVRRLVAESLVVGPITNIVFMGMGEPFDNLKEVVRAIALLSTQQAFGFPPSRITVSTVGCADKLATFFQLTRAELAISINAPDDARRSAIMPINERFDLATLRRALVAALPPGRRVLFQYALFAGFNDALADADALAAFAQGIRCRVNVIPANPGPDRTLVAPPDAVVDAFVARLRGHGLTTLVRRPRGRDVGGACGQLAGAHRRLTCVGP